MIEVAQAIQSILIGAGNRGMEVYGEFALAHPWLFQFVAVADPDPDRRKLFAQKHTISPDRSFADWRDALNFAAPGQLVFICSPDRSHHEQVEAFAEKGLPIVLEKPVVAQAWQCVDIQRCVARTKADIIACHVLRYTPFFTAIKKILAEKRIGSVRSFNLQENIAWYHFAHSYVRGNWRSADMASPAILAKCVHDLDILFWLADSPAERIASMGELSWFRAENAPDGAPSRCMEGCAHADGCPWHAPDLYLGENTEWPVSVISLDKSIEARSEALATGPYGRCVYHCDNDVADQQDLLIRFKNGVQASLSMKALSYDKTRVIQVCGSEGELIGDLEKGRIELRNFFGGAQELIEPGPVQGAHNGGDTGLMLDIARVFHGGKSAADSASAIEVSLEAHWMAFAAEYSREKKCFVDMDEFKTGTQGAYDAMNTIGGRRCRSRE